MTGTPERGGLPIGVIVAAVLLGAALLVVLALSVPALLQRLQEDPAPTFAVGDCVIRDGDAAQPADCTEPDAYEIVVEVGRIEDCPAYPQQPAVNVDNGSLVFCLEPAGGAAETPAAPTETNG